MTEQEKQKLREWNDAAKPNDRERDIPTKWIDALLDENAALQSSVMLIKEDWEDIKRCIEIFYLASFTPDNIGSIEMRERIARIDSQLSAMKGEKND